MGCVGVGVCVDGCVCYVFLSVWWLCVLCVCGDEYLCVYVFGVCVVGVCVICVCVCVV